LEDIKKKDYRIGVAAGGHKVDCICGALNGGYINVLITDEETAKNVLDRLESLDRK
jgi:deoxyribonucleoside regulator